MRCDDGCGLGAVASNLFQSTHLREVRRCPLLFLCRSLSISIHAPTWGATKNQKVDSELRQFQSTHLREVRRGRYFWRSKYLWISIHAPTWGATGFCRIGCLFVVISIHAPTWGATTFAILDAPEQWYFNPRTYVRCDRYCLINAHALAYFNPRTYVRCDNSLVVTGSPLETFQSTHLREVRPWLVFRDFCSCMSFQSTHLREVRLKRLARDLLLI